MNNEIKIAIAFLCLACLSLGFILGLLVLKNSLSGNNCVPKGVIDPPCSPTDKNCQVC